MLCGGYTKADQNISLMYLQDNEIKPADEVFLMSYSEDGGVLKVNWSIEDGYYLYFDSILIKENQEIVVLLKFGNKINGYPGLLHGGI